jgi:hypothetical protein
MSGTNGDGAARCDQCGAPVRRDHRILVLGATSSGGNYEHVYCTPACLTQALQSKGDVQRGRRWERRLEL